MVYSLTNYLYIFLILDFFVQFVDISQTNDRKRLGEVFHEFFVFIGSNISNSGTFSLEAVKKNVAIVVPSYQWFLMLPLYLI